MQKPLQKPWYFLALFSAILLASCSSGTPATPPNSNISTLTATVYQDVDFMGQSETLKVGKYFASKNDLNNVGNKAISSLRIPVGLFVRLCEGDGSSAQLRPCLGLGGDTPSLLQFWNDRASSLEIGTDAALATQFIPSGNWVLRVTNEEAYTFELTSSAGLLKIGVRQSVYGPDLSQEVFSGIGQVKGDVMLVSKPNGLQDRWAFLSDTKARVEYATTGGILTLEANR
jgi:hypothetical protein